jgi:hypothetical protein
MTTPAPSLLDAALALHAAGLCVLPAAEDGSKRPAVDWKAYQAERPDVAQLRRWFSGSRTGLGVVAGAVSGGIEMTELEGRADLPKVMEAVRAAGEQDLWDRIVNGFSVASPSGGVHCITRNASGEVEGNTKLAATAEHVTLAETRGEGGWFVTAPSFGHVHPTKKPWAVISGSPATIATLTADERERFHALLRTLDERPVAAPAEPTPFAPLSRSGGSDGVSPGDDYNARTTWDEVLTADGWRRAFARGEVTIMWTRPGKTHGISATTGYQGDWLYVFTLEHRPGARADVHPVRLLRRLAPPRRPPGRRQGAAGPGLRQGRDDGRPAGAAHRRRRRCARRPARGCRRAGADLRADRHRQRPDAGGAVRRPAALRARARVVAALDGPPLGLR